MRQHCWHPHAAALQLALNERCCHCGELRYVLSVPQGHGKFAPVQRVETTEPCVGQQMPAKGLTI